MDGRGTGGGGDGEESSSLTVIVGGVTRCTIRPRADARAAPSVCLSRVAVASAVDLAVTTTSTVIRTLAALMVSVMSEGWMPLPNQTARSPRNCSALKASSVPAAVKAKLRILT